MVKKFTPIILFSLSLCSSANAQLFAPVPVSGFNQDVVAESGTSSLTTTTMALDGTTSSNKVMYTQSFRTSAGLGGGGILDNGTLTDASGTYQLAPYTGNNALLLQRSQTGTLTLTTPASFSVLRIAGFSTEGSSLINAVINFTDGTTFAGLTNNSLSDWFNVTTNLVTSGFGRVTRATPATGADGYTTNPRIYYREITIPCASRYKLVQSITLSNVTTTGNNAPYPNAVFLALSGKSVTQTITPTITNATCTTAGSASLAITGSASPFTVSWNTTPVQTGLSATNLTAGTYTATITDAAGCINTTQVTIIQTNDLNLTTPTNSAVCAGQSYTPTLTGNATTYAWSPATGVSDVSILNPIFTPTATTTYTLTATLGTCTVTRNLTVTVNPNPTISARADTAICNGASFNPRLISNGTSFSWSPTTGVSNATVLNPTLSPTSTTTYTLTATLGTCTATRSFVVTVNPTPTLGSRADTAICRGASFSPNISALNAATFLWSPTNGVSVASVQNPTLSPTATTTYTLTATSAAGCIATRSFTLNMLASPSVNAGPDVSIFQGQTTAQLNATASAGTYLWTPSAGLSSVTILNPIANPTTTTTYALNVTGTNGCSANDSVKVTVIPYCVQPLNAFTPNGDGIHDTWHVYSVYDCLKNVKVFIYNRYGAKVFESRDYRNNWDGTYKGKPVPDGTYYAVINYTLITGREITVKTDVNIIR